MKATDVISALELPGTALVDRRVAKSLLVANGAPTGADKRRINEGIEEIEWRAALKPSAIGVPAFCDERREYLEIAVLAVTLRPAAKAARLVELTHRAIPYPTVLLTEWSGLITISLGHKRRAENEAGKFVLDEGLVACEVVECDQTPAFLSSLALARQPRAHLWARYQGWIDCLIAWKAALITGRPLAPGNAVDPAVQREALAAHERLTRAISSLHTQAKGEKQVARRVQLNLEIRRLKRQLSKCNANL